MSETLTRQLDLNSSMVDSVLFLGAGPLSEPAVEIFKVNLLGSEMIRVFHLQLHDAETFANTLLEIVNAKRAKTSAEAARVKSYLTDPTEEDMLLRFSTQQKAAPEKA